MRLTTSMRLLVGLVLCTGSLSGSARAAVLQYGDQDVLGTGVYPGDPTVGSTQEGLAPGVVTFGQPPLFHGFPFVPAGDYPGTDQIYTGSAQTGVHDGYAASAPTLGPQVIAMDYSSLIPPGQSVSTLTLGIGADDFQFPAFGQPFSASINGVVDADLTAALNGLSQNGPVVQYFTIGISPAVLLPSNILTLSIDQGGDGGDGWAIDFLTVGVTAVPEPATWLLLSIGAAGLGLVSTRRRSNT